MSDSSPNRREAVRVPQGVRFILLAIWTGFSVVLTNVIQGAWNGFIGNRSDALITDFLHKHVGKDITVPFNWLLTALASIVILVPSMFALYLLSRWSFRVRERALQKVNQFLTELNNLDDTFVRLFTLLDVGSDTEDSLKKLIDAYLDQVLQIFDAQHPDNQLDTCHVVIYRPDPLNSDNYLTAWHGFNAPLEDKNLRFPIGPVAASVKRGVAGKVFFEGAVDSAAVTHVFKTSQGTWEVTGDYKDDYIFPGNGGRRTPSHRAIASIPLTSNTTGSKLLPRQ